MKKEKKHEYLNNLKVLETETESYVIPPLENQPNAGEYRKNHSEQRWV